MVNYKTVFQRYVGSPFFTKDVEIGHTAICLADGSQGGAAAERSMKSTKTGSVHIVATNQKFKMLGVIIHSSAATFVVITESAALDTVGATIKFAATTPGIGEYIYPLDNVKFSAGKYINLTIPAGNTLYQVSVTGFETTNL